MKREKLTEKIDIVIKIRMNIIKQIQRYFPAIMLMTKETINKKSR